MTPSDVVALTMQLRHAQEKNVLRAELENRQRTIDDLNKKLQVQKDRREELARLRAKCTEWEESTHRMKKDKDRIQAELKAREDAHSQLQVELDRCQQIIKAVKMCVFLDASLLIVGAGLPIQKYSRRRWQQQSGVETGRWSSYATTWNRSKSTPCCSRISHIR